MGLKKPKFDLNEVMKNYSNGMSVLSQFSELTTGTFQHLTQLQTQFAKESVEEVNGVVRQMMAAPAGQRASLSQQAVTQGLNRVMTHGNAVAQMLAKSGKEMAQSVTEKSQEETA
jgi:hypothetical protein